MNDSPERIPVKLLGRTIGTASGWDGDDTSMVFYEFTPHTVLADDLPPGDLSFSYDEGDFSYYDDDGKRTKTIDAMKVLSMIQRDN